MSAATRLALIALFFGLTLAACGRTVQEDTPDSVADAIDEEEFGAVDSADEIEVEGEFVHLAELIRAIRRASDRESIESTLTQARLDGYSDVDIASAMGVNHFLSPGRRVLLAIEFVRFKGESSVPPEELDAAYEYASTPPRLREQMAAEANAAESPAADETVTTEAVDDAASDDEETGTEDEAPRQRGWRRWIPGL